MPLTTKLKRGIETFIYRLRSCRGPVRDRMVVGFTTTYAISAYHHSALIL